MIFFNGLLIIFTNLSYYMVFLKAFCSLILLHNLINGQGLIQMFAVTLVDWFIL